MLFVTGYCVLLWIGFISALRGWHGGTDWFGPGIVAAIISCLTVLILRDFDTLQTAEGPDPIRKSRDLKRYLVRLLPSTMLLCLFVAGIQALNGRRVEHFWVDVLLSVPLVASDRWDFVFVRTRLEIDSPTTAETKVLTAIEPKSIVISVSLWWKFTSHKPQATSHKPQATSHKLHPLCLCGEQSPPPA